MASDLLTPIPDFERRNINYFQGRVLTAEDLQIEQATNRRHHAEFGRALGTGVARGLEVSIADRGTGAAPAALAITAGVAINGEGQLLRLDGDQTIRLVQPPAEAEARAGIFQDCERGPSDLLPTGAGVYVLVMSPASVFREFALTSGLDDGGTAVGCGRRFAVEAVQFRLEQLPVDSFTELATERAALSDLGSGSGGDDARILSRFRNALAHLLFRTAGAATQRPRLRAGEDAAFPAVSSAMDALGLDRCEVPLSLIYWDTGGIRFQDSWMVRRLARQVLDPDVLSLFPAFGLERLLQFQRQLWEIADPALQPATHRVEDFFRYLPPAGWVPLGDGRGVAEAEFFATFSVQSSGILETGLFAELVERSFRHTAVDLQDTPQLELFALAENQAAVASRSFRAFVARELNQPAAGSALGDAFASAWTAYRGLIARGDLMPAGTSRRALLARITLLEVLRGVLDIANRHTATALAWALDRRTGLDALRALHTQQRDLVELLTAPAAGVDENRQNFAAELERRLAEQGTALDNGRLLEALRLQLDINGFVDRWRDQ